MSSDSFQEETTFSPEPYHKYGERRLLRFVGERGRLVEKTVVYKSFYFWTSLIRPPGLIIHC